ncbi:MAG TPA: DUF4381 domain-containing protein [Steroidobacteraceae bacterium]|nr:DUF4381 domain-containing protein [Steroidobacteraceae bacterium]
MSGNWLAQLAPDRAPAAIGWWPPALGWWLSGLALIVLTLLVGGAVRAWRAPHRRARRAALRDLGRIRAGRAEGVEAAQAIEQLLRRYAIALCGRERVARLSGESWLSFARAAGGELFGGDAGRSLLTAAFGERPSARREEWLHAAEEFIRRAPRTRRVREGAPRIAG